ncbi:MAG TPA: hypothetical protein VF367_02430 [Candidatus Limnocylindria bacterium]
MHEGIPSAPQERPIEPSEPPPPATASDPARDATLDDPRLLTILSTEHWSLLSARGLAYNEAFVRAGMFFTLLATSLVAISFLANAVEDAPETLVVVAAFLLGLVFIVGVLTTIRIVGCNIEDANAMQGMNRIRNGYVQIVPGVAPFFVTDIHDDNYGVARSYGFKPSRPMLRDLVYGLSTSAGLVVIVDAIVGGAIGAVVAIWLGASLGASIVIGIVTAVGSFVLLFLLAIWLTLSAGKETVSIYPSPDAPEGGGW